MASTSSIPSSTSANAAYESGDIELRFGKDQQPLRAHSQLLKLASPTVLAPMLDAEPPKVSYLARQRIPAPPPSGTENRREMYFAGKQWADTRSGGSDRLIAGPRMKGTKGSLKRISEQSIPGKILHGRIMRKPDIHNLRLNKTD
eukprot:gene7105-209_t